MHAMRVHAIPSKVANWALKDHATQALQAVTRRLSAKTNVVTVTSAVINPTLSETWICLLE